MNTKASRPPPKRA